MDNGTSENGASGDDSDVFVVPFASDEEIDFGGGHSISDSSDDDDDDDDDDEEEEEEESEMEVDKPDDPDEEESVSTEANNVEQNGKDEESYDEDASSENDDEAADEKKGDDASRFVVLGDQKFVKNKRISSAPIWAKKAETFSAEIKPESELESFLGLDPKLFAAVKQHISSWFPVQKTALPQLLYPYNFLPSRDYAISAPTGSGKTMCYVIPILNRIIRSTLDDYVTALVMAPLRTLLLQIEKEFAALNTTGVKIVVLNGNDSYEVERKKLFPDGQNCKAKIIISTPTRFLDHLFNRDGKIDLSHLRYLVVDEADTMKRFREEWLEIVEKRADYPQSHAMTYKSLTTLKKNIHLQKILVSATLSFDANKLHAWNLRAPRLFRAERAKVVEVRPVTETEEAMEENGSTEEPQKPKIRNELRPTDDVDKLTLPSCLFQEIRSCNPKYKPLYIYSYLKSNPEWKKALIFVHKNEDSERLCHLLRNLFEDQRKVFLINSNVMGNRRYSLLKSYSSVKNGILIATDVVGRGVDLPEINAVLNYDCPMNAMVYVHRVGRTARAGRTGFAVTLAEKEERIRLKRDLLKVDLWDDEFDNRDTGGAEFIEKHRERYQSALDALRERYEERPEDQNGTKSNQKRHNSKPNGNADSVRREKRRYSAI